MQLLLLGLALLSPALARIASVMRLGEYYYYDVTRFLVERRFQVRYVSDWSERDQWVVAAGDWGRRSAGASLRLSGLEEVRGVTCGRHHVCLESGQEPGNFLVAWQEGRMVWQRQPGVTECGHVSQIFLSPPNSLSTVLYLLHCRPPDRAWLLQVSDRAGPGPGPGPGQPPRPPLRLRQVPRLVLDRGVLVRQ